MGASTSRASARRSSSTSSMAIRTIPSSPGVCTTPCRCRRGICRLTRRKVVSSPDRPRGACPALGCTTPPARPTRFASRTRRARNSCGCMHRRTSSPRSRTMKTSGWARTGAKPLTATSSTRFTGTEPKSLTATRRSTCMAGGPKRSIWMKRSRFIRTGRSASITTRPSPSVTTAPRMWARTRRSTSGSISP